VLHPVNYKNRKNLRSVAHAIRRHFFGENASPNEQIKSLKFNESDKKAAKYWENSGQHIHLFYKC